MAITADALWLNTVFAGYDHAILSFLHKLADAAGVVLTPLCRLITLLGEKGLLFFLLAVVLMIFPRWRRTGVCIFGAVCCGALISNILLKDAIARPRPFESVEVFRQWWQAVGAPAEEGFSFRTCNGGSSRCDGAVSDAREKMDSAGMHLGAAHDGFPQLPDGTLSFRCSLCPSHRGVFRFCRSGDYAAHFPLPGEAQRRG